MRRETSHSIKDQGVVVDRLRGGTGFAKHGDKNYREPMRASGFFGEQQQAGAHAATAEAKPARWYQDPAGPRPKIAWLGGSASGAAARAGRPLWAAPMSGGGSKGGGAAAQAR